MTAALILAYLALVAGAVPAALLRWRPAAARRAALVLPLWLAYVGAVSWSGLVRDPAMRPPGIVLIVAPVVLFVAFGVVRGTAAGRLAVALPLPLLIGAQAYRLGVELFLHRLWQEGLVPSLLTLGGGNLDALTALAAPLAAWAAVRGRWGARAALAWNVFGLATLANVVARSALTAPGPLNLLPTVPPNLAIGTFPYTFIAGFFAPLAVVLHVLAIRALVARLAVSDARPAALADGAAG